MTQALDTPFHLTGKRILVTGASSGIGREICVQIGNMGGIVIATGRDQTRLDETLAMLGGGDHRGITADLTIPDQRAALATSATSLHGVVHSAGLMKQVPFRFLSEKHLREMMFANCEAPILLTQAMLHGKTMSDGGSIVFISSTAASLGAKALAAYSASKAAVTAAVRVLALEVAPRRIRANCIAPAMVETPMAVKTEDAVSAETMAEHRKLYPLGFGHPDDVANAVVFLLSDASKRITGTTLIVDGGYSCQ
jgi:NAD(P)-dependent dehydrogenase (short-subunit alcohol dehydrogenase family)